MAHSIDAILSYQHILSYANIEEIRWIFLSPLIRGENWDGPFI